MSTGLTLVHEVGRHVEVMTKEGALLFRYVYIPDTPQRESRRPYAHPVRSLAGDVLTNFRPNDHPWHHGLSLTITQVSGVNFWGGPSYRGSDGYQWRDDHGIQEHRSWLALAPEQLVEDVEWCEGTAAGVLLKERREMNTTLSSNGWSLHWTSELVNVSGRELTFDTYHSAEALAGSHYTGLQFRGARELLDDHGDTTLGVTGEGGVLGEAAVHGQALRWMKWSCQHDGSLRRTNIRFESPDGPLPWFVRAKNPIAAFAFQRERGQSLSPGGTLRLHHRLTFTSP